MQIQPRLLSIRENIVLVYIGKLLRNEFPTKFNFVKDETARCLLLYLTLNNVSSARRIINKADGSTKISGGCVMSFVIWKNGTCRLQIKIMCLCRSLISFSTIWGLNTYHFNNGR